MLDLTSVDLLDAFTQELKLCRLRPGEHVVILSEPTSRGDYVAAAFGAAKACGAHVIAATVPSGNPSPTDSTHTGAGPGLTAVLNDATAQELLKAADLVVDLTREGFIHAPCSRRSCGRGPASSSSATPRTSSSVTCPSRGTRPRSSRAWSW